MGFRRRGWVETITKKVKCEECAKYRTCRYDKGGYKICSDFEEVR